MALIMNPTDLHQENDTLLTMKVMDNMAKEMKMT